MSFSKKKWFEDSFYLDVGKDSIKKLGKKKFTQMGQMLVQFMANKKSLKDGVELLKEHFTEEEVFYFTRAIKNLHLSQKKIN